DNAAVRIWSEKTRLEKGDSLTEGYISEFYFTFGKVDLVPTVEEYTTLLHSPKETNEHYENEWAIGCSPDQAKGDVKCIPWNSLRDLILAHPDMKTRVDVFALSIYRLIVFPKVLRHVDEVASNLFDRLDKRVTSVPAILAKTFRSLNACWRAGEGRFTGCA
ncbi:hypothetical protein Golob_027625, partial [Gossypium lobatum]|nr:hypothetical protein [Gossypium lobatum]